MAKSMPSYVSKPVDRWFGAASGTVNLIIVIQEFYNLGHYRIWQPSRITLAYSILKGRQLIDGLRVSLFKWRLLFYESTYIVIIDQETPSNHNHLHLGHDCVVPQFCSFNVANYSCTNYSCICLTNHASYEEGKTTPSRDVMLVCCSACRSTLFVLGGRRATCSIDMSSIFLRKNCEMLLGNALKDAPNSSIASDDKSSVRDDPSQVKDSNDLDHLLLSWR